MNESIISKVDNFSLTEKNESLKADNTETEAAVKSKIF